MKIFLHSDPASKQFSYSRWDVARATCAESWIVRSSAADALGAIGPAAAEATPPLIELLLDTDEYFQEQVRRSAAGALGKLGPGAVPHLIIALENPRLPIRIAAAEALGEIGATARPASR